MTQKNTDKDSWNKYYSVSKVGKLTNTIFNLLNREPVNSKIRKSINKDIDNIGAILEAGCGDGKKLKMLLNSKANHIMGLDFSENAVRVAHKANPDAHIICRSDIRKLPFQDNSIDYIISLGVIEHFEKPILLVNEMARVLKKDGILFLTTPNNISLNKHIVEIAEQRFGRQDLYSPSELSNICKLCGLSVLEAYDCDFAEAFGGWFYHTHLKKLPFQRFFGILYWWAIIPVLRIIDPFIKNHGFLSVVISKKKDA
jgi:ubiquinone/menaquinone biosynthesis C-methylase UbiE